MYIIVSSLRSRRLRGKRAPAQSLRSRPPDSPIGTNRLLLPHFLPPFCGGESNLPNSEDINLVYRWRSFMAGVLDIVDEVFRDAHHARTQRERVLIDSECLAYRHHDLLKNHRRPWRYLSPTFIRHHQEDALLAVPMVVLLFRDVGPLPVLIAISVVDQFISRPVAHIDRTAAPAFWIHHRADRHDNHNAQSQREQAVPQTVATRIAPVVIAPPTRMTTGEDVAAPRPNLPGSFLFRRGNGRHQAVHLPTATSRFRVICP